jgi:hypothetical protein
VSFEHVFTCVASMQYVPAVPVPPWAAVQVLSQLQAPPMPAPLHVWCVPQATVAVTSRQLSESAAQVDWWPASGQNEPGAVQPAGGVLHTQDCAPAVPPQVWRGPQLCVVEMTMQLFASGAQVVVCVALEQ